MSALDKLRLGFRFCRVQDRLGFLGADFMHEQIAPADFPAMRLQHDGALGRQRLGPIPEVLHHGAVHHQLLVQPDPRPCADLPDAELVPLAEGFVREDQRISAGRTRGVVEKAAGAEVRFAVGVLGIEDF